MKKIAFHNLGCKVNTYELDAMMQMLIDEGYQQVPFEEKADIYIINTCTVTNIADRKSRQMIHKARKNNPDAVIVAVAHAEFQLLDINPLINKNGIVLDIKGILNPDEYNKYWRL